MPLTHKNFDHTPSRPAIHIVAKNICVKSEIKVFVITEFNIAQIFFAIATAFP